MGGNPPMISNNLLAQLFSEESNDPFLMLLTIYHPDFPTIRLVNNTVDIVSRSETFQAFPFKFKLPVEDGESQRNIEVQIDNTSLELVSSFRSVITPMDVLVELVLASDSDNVQIDIPDLKLRGITYDKNRISATLVLDSFLYIAMNSETYNRENFPGIF
jgi:hypothetical protein